MISDPLGRAGALLTVDLGAIAENWRRLAALVAPGECAAAVKADAYGLGAAAVAPALWTAGARTFFVAWLDEGIALRRVLPEARIAVLGGVLPGQAEEFRAHRLVPVLNHLGEIALWAASAARYGAPLSAFIHLDSGMNRLGLPPGEQAVLAAEPERLAGIALAGWLGHFACSEQPEHPKNREQLEFLRAALTRLPAAPLSLANSSGIFLGAGYHGELARPGAALYGLNPTPGRPNPMQDAVRLDARILQVRRVDPPMTVGYGATHRVAGPSKIATLAVGYADGYGRALSGLGRVFIAGAPAPVVGRVSMDLLTVDVSHLPDEAAAPGALAQVIGPDIPPDAVAAAAGTIGYEILTSLGARYARRYIGPAA